MKSSSRLIRAGSVLACVLAVAGAASAAGAAPTKGLPRGATVIGKIAIPPETGTIAVGEGAVWVLSWHASRLTRIGPTGKVVAAITVKPRKPCPPSPEACGEIAAGEGAVWISLRTDNAVARVDPGTNLVTATVPVGPEPEGIATSAGAIWVANADGPSVTRIDPTTNKVVATIRVAPAKACCDRMTVNVGEGSVWVAVPKAGTVVRIDPATNKVIATIKLSWLESGQPCGYLAIDHGTVWSAGAHCGSSSGYSVVTPIDVDTNTPGKPVVGFEAPIGLAVGFGSVWVVDLDAKAIARIDPRTARIVARLPVGGLPIQIAAGFGSIWVRDDTGLVLRIKPQG
jgi:YVTN family beta-propeller protein